MRPAAPPPAPDALLLAAAIASVAVMVKIVWPRFTWFGDNAELFFPLWHMVGTALREGRWLGFDPTAFAGGNVVGEANYGLFNPVTLAQRDCSSQASTSWRGPLSSSPPSS